MKTRIILMLIVVAAVATAAQAWTWDEETYPTAGWNAVYNSPMSWDVWDDDPPPTGTGGIWSWWFPPDGGSIAAAGGQASVQTNKWNTIPAVAPPRTTNRYEYAPDADVTKWGVEWIAPSWSGKSADMAVIAAYISPGEIFGQNDFGYQLYRPSLYSWEDKQYFKSDLRVAAVNSGGASISVKTYSYDNTANWWDWYLGVMTPIGENIVALDAGDNVWQHLQLNLLKPDGLVAENRGVWFEVSIIGGSADTRLYIDDFRAVSDQAYDSSYMDATLIPEPATMLILALGGLMLRRNRK